MLPKISNVIDIRQGIIFPLQYILDLNNRIRLGLPIIPEVDIPYLMRVFPKIVKVGVCPPHANLDNMMKSVQRNVLTDQKSSPDFRRNLVQCDFELVHGSGFEGKGQDFPNINQTGEQYGSIRYL